MFSTADYLGNEPWAGLIRMISDRTYLSLHPSHCELVSLTALEGLKTRVRFTTRRSSSATNILPSLPSELTFDYTRLDPAQYIGTRTIRGLKVPTDTTALLKALTQQTGITFNIDDFEAFDITDYGQVTLISKPSSLRWVGSFTVNLVNDTALALPGQITQASLGNVFLVPSTTDTRQVDTIYFSNTDFTKHRDLLRSLGNSPNGVHDDRLAVIFEDITGDPWTCSTEPSAFNLASEVFDGVPRSRILYTGAPVARYTTRTDKRSLVVLALDETLCTGLKGRILIHYD